MKLLNKVILASVLATTLAGCSSKVEQRNDLLTNEAKVYTKSKAVYCEGSKVKSFANDESFIAIRCEDNSSKVIFLD